MYMQDYWYVYSAETWTVNRHLENRVEAMEVWIYRRVDG